MNRKTLERAREELLNVWERDKDRIQADWARHLAESIEDFLRYRYSTGKRTGRHARSAVRRRDLELQRYCYEKARELVDSGKAKNLSAAFVMISETIDPEPETIRIYYYRQRKLRTSRTQPASKSR